MRQDRSSLRILSRHAALPIYAGLTLWLGVACNASGAGGPTPTVVPVASSLPAAAPSPSRPQFASPGPSPSPAVANAATASPVPDTSTAAGDTYEIASGDTLGSIAEKLYGDQTQWRRIYDANKDAIGSDPDKLTVGMKLKIPPKQS